MTTILKFTAFVLILTVSVEATKLPSYITPCKRDDPELNECARKNGQAAISTIVKGDKAYRIPVLAPLKLTHIGIDASENLVINIVDIDILGLEESVVKDAVINIKDQTLKFTIHIPKATLIGQYDVDGKILILPIQGNGACNITNINGNYVYSVSYELVESKKGKQHFKIMESSITYETERSYFYLENLFNGDKILGGQMNKFLNENWEEVNKDIGPAISDTISQIITLILTGIFDKVPYSEILI